MIALLTYAHHIVDTLANSTDQWIDYPSAKHFEYLRLKPLYIARAGRAVSKFYSTGGIYSYFRLANIIDDELAYFAGVRVGSVGALTRQYRIFGHSLRCVAHSKPQFVF